MSHLNKGLTFPYSGARAAWFVYHPAHHGPCDIDGVWENARSRFQGKLDSFCDVCEMYTDQQVFSESVGGPRWKTDVMKMVNAIEKDHKEVYQLEALAYVIFDVEDKLSQRMMPSHEEIRMMSKDFRRLDSGLFFGGPKINPKALIERSWGS